MKGKIETVAATSARAALSVALIRSFTYSIFGLGRRLFGFPGVHFGSGVKLIGSRRMKIGANTVVGSGSWLNVNRMDGNPDALIVGENCLFGQDNFINVGRQVIIGDYCLTARNCIFNCSVHVYSDPFHPYASTGTTDEGGIYIGANCFFGYGVNVIGTVRIGHGCVIGAGAYIREDVPPFSLVVGNPAKVIKRFNFSSNSWVRWPCADYTDGPLEIDYLKILRSNKRWILHQISAASRGALYSR